MGHPGGGSGLEWRRGVVVLWDLGATGCVGVSGGVRGFISRAVRVAVS